MRHKYRNSTQFQVIPFRKDISFNHIIKNCQFNDREKKEELGLNITSGTVNAHNIKCQII